MQFNLIDERWIPVKRRDGTATMIAPWEVTDQFVENPVVALNAPRPDFNGALIQFLIGLVQTVAAPRNGSEWRKKLVVPPTPDELHIPFAIVRHAFELGGDGPRFMQAFEPFDDFTIAGIAGLLIDAPGQHALEKNTDHFVKRGIVNKMCPACSATALFTSQINAYGDGPGYRTSLRGGSGPLTTLVISDERHNTLWQMIWLNILEQKSYLGLCGNQDKNLPQDTFAWLAPTRTSEKDTGADTTPMDVHPYQMFWSMSQRIKLVPEEAHTGVCDLCGTVFSGDCITVYHKKNGGVNYVGSWLHPLTPYGRKEDGTTIPGHGERGGITYRHWLGYVQADSAKNRAPAKVVHNFYQRTKPDWQFRLWVFGYDIYNSAKIRCWYEAKMPLLIIDNNLLKLVENETASLVVSASEVISNTKSAVKRALFSKVKEIKKNGEAVWETPSSIKEDKKELFYQIALSFWQNTEAAFYRTVYQIRNNIEAGSAMNAKLEWHRNLCSEAEKIFSSCVMLSSFEDADPKRVVIASKELENFNRGNKIKELLGLPVAPKAATKPAKKKATSQPKQMKLEF